MNRLVAILACVLCGGCSSAIAPRAPASVSHTEVIGASVEGREIRVEILVRRGPALLIFGVIHGNEPLGAPLLERFLAHLKENPALFADRRLVVIPVLNPDGLAGRSRYNSRGVDLNRNFPASNFRKSRRNGPYPSSEPETKALMKMIRQFRPSRVLAVHSPLFCMNYDGPAEGPNAATGVMLCYVRGVDSVHSKRAMAPNAAKRGPCVPDPVPLAGRRSGALFAPWMCGVGWPRTPGRLPVNGAASRRTCTSTVPQIS